MKTEPTAASKRLQFKYMPALVVDESQVSMLVNSAEFDESYACCRKVAELLGLQEGVHYEHVCLGESGFSYMIDNLARKNTTLPPQCDMGVSSITASVEREEMGIQFSRTSHRSALAVMVYAPLKHAGMWGFFEPLHWYIWIALVCTIFITPFFVFFFESVFSTRYGLSSTYLLLHAHARQVLNIET
jgi:hypothetical protein